MVWLLGFMSEWGRELESCVPHFSLPLHPPPPGPSLGFGEGLPVTLMLTGGLS